MAHEDLDHIRAVGAPLREVLDHQWQGDIEGVDASLTGYFKLEAVEDLSDDEHSPDLPQDDRLFGRP